MWTLKVISSFIFGFCDFKVTFIEHDFVMDDVKTLEKQSLCQVSNVQCYRFT